MSERFPKNVEGNFYTTGHQDKNGKWCGDCLWCGLPENEAPDLLAEINDENIDTYFVKQPHTPEEVDRAIAATEVCCVQALRYKGTNKDILARLDPSICDFHVSQSGGIVPNIKVKKHSKLLQRIKKIYTFFSR